MEGGTHDKVLTPCLPPPAPVSAWSIPMSVSPDGGCKVLSFMPGDSPQPGVEGSCAPEASSAISPRAAPSAW